MNSTIIGTYCNSSYIFIVSNLLPVLRRNFKKILFYILRFLDNNRYFLFFSDCNKLKMENIEQSMPSCALKCLRNVEDVSQNVHKIKYGVVRIYIECAIIDITD